MIGLACIGAAEAVVFLLRYRSAHSPSHWWSACTSFLIALLRAAFVVTGARLAFEGQPAELVAGVLVYAGTAALVTAGLHRWLEQRKRQRQALASRSRPTGRWADGGGA